MMYIDTHAFARKSHFSLEFYFQKKSVPIFNELLVQQISDVLWRGIIRKMHCRIAQCRNQVL
eukprot:TRINITY_DN16316_c0_g1_i1.p1 TRINITY_DN16316_c0_g1~~TRINITY_DN16316_c0_g1_i1.p1  ORF type:complete len:62 (+),score=4.94 TRINITY_DN16316_c0_g1_i1:93-278(+)